MLSNRSIESYLIFRDITWEIVIRLYLVILLNEAFACHITLQTRCYQLLSNYVTDYKSISKNCETLRQLNTQQFISSNLSLYRNISSWFLSLDNISF
jgi:hypothetical protein